MHNLSKYDAHLILKAYEKDVKISCIASSMEKFLTFNIGAFKFIDSMSFTEASLDTLVETLKSAGPEKFIHLIRSLSYIETYYFKKVFTHMIIWIALIDLMKQNDHQLKHFTTN